MRPAELIKKKRLGEVHTAEEIEALVHGLCDGSVRDYQASAWLMAAFLKGLNRDEMLALTRAMWRSGASIPRPENEGEHPQYWVDKHSTGGVGDKLSLILVPLVTSLAERLMGPGLLKIPMISGRALGFTGGTLDKLESVPGFQASLPISQATGLLEQNGFFMIGQTSELAPADKILYALRDATATVESIPLIVASILSKKRSESLNGIIFDVKVGEGAFMADFSSAKELATTLVQTAKLLGIESRALLTDMNEPIGYAVGNALEVEECAEFLSGKSQEPGMKELVVSLTSQLLELASHGEIDQGTLREEIDLELNSRRPLALFVRMFEAQGGRWDAFVASMDSEAPKLTATVFRAPSRGSVQRIEASRIGNLLNEMGGGRKTKEDKIDPHVGIRFHAKVGSWVESGAPLATVFHRPGYSADAVSVALEHAIHLSAVDSSPTVWIREVIS